MDCHSSYNVLLPLKYHFSLNFVISVLLYYEIILVLSAKERTFATFANREVFTSSPLIGKSELVHDSPITIY